MRKRVRLRREDVEAVFASATSQADYVVGLYKLVLPDWDDIDDLQGHPQVSEETWGAICNLAMDWDRTHVNSLPGGAWLNYGFSGRKDLPDWTVDLRGVKLVYKSRVTEASPC